MAVEIIAGQDTPKTPDGQGRKSRKWVAAIIAALLFLFLAAGGMALRYYSDYRDAGNFYDTLESAHTRIDLNTAGGWSPAEHAGQQAVPEGDANADVRVPGVAGIDFPDLGIDHAALYAINPDYMGWVWIEDMISDIHISYPFLQGETNDEYLRTDMEGNRITAGSIFADYNTPADFSEHHTILYGHNMLDGSMFSDLKKYLGTADQGQERYFYIFLRDGSVLKCRLFSAHVVSKNSTIYQIDMSDNLYREFFPRVLGESDDDWGCSDLVPDSIPEKTVTLSTCHGRSGTSKRMAVHAYIDTWYVDRDAIVPDIVQEPDTAQEPETGQEPGPGPDDGEDGAYGTGE